MADTKVGVVSHYFDKIGVAIIEVEAPIKIGDKLKFVRKGEELFQQEVTSMQIEHQQIEAAKKGDGIGVKVDQKVHEGVEVYKAEA
jgi:putative protease